MILCNTSQTTFQTYRPIQSMCAESERNGNRSGMGRKLNRLSRSGAVSERGKQEAQL